MVQINLLDADMAKLKELAKKLGVDVNNSNGNKAVYRDGHVDSWFVDMMAIITKEVLLNKWML